GILTLEQHVEKPDASALFQKYPIIMNDHGLLNFLCDSLKILVVGSVSPHDLESLMESDLATQEEDALYPSHSFATIGDALPGLGIVAAVLGIVITMGSIGGDVTAVGHHVAAALVGTFLGVLGSYGFVQPISANLKHIGENKLVLFICIKNGIVAFAKGQAPTIAVEFARRSIPEHERPSFTEMDQAFKALKSEAKK
ncbi:MAG: flagellar motor stator protein MotA, partial [Desulfobacterales bacterium]|nr:flagellar motor stator protein MotA [Desulfobacterales bacterium]